MPTSTGCEIEWLDNTYIEGYDGTPVTINGDSLDDGGSEVDDVSEVGREGIEGELVAVEESRYVDCDSKMLDLKDFDGGNI